MSAMRISRYHYRRRGNSVNCGCLVALAGVALVLVVVILMLIPVLPVFAMRVMGFSPVGRTEEVFVEMTPLTPPRLENAVSLSQVTVDLGSYGLQNLPQTGAYTVAVDGDRGITVASVSETGLMEVCYQISAACAGGDSRYRNPRVDFHPSGAVVYVDVRIPTIGIWQMVGVVLRLRGAAQFEVAGVDIDGVLYDAPPDGLGEMVGDFERVGNDVLRQLIVRVDGRNYTLSEVYIDETTATLVLR